MKHISSERLDELEDLLQALRRFDGLVEKKRGVFYRKSRAFLHFHEDSAGLFADVRLDARGDFDRLRVSTKKERGLLIRGVKRSLEE